MRRNGRFRQETLHRNGEPATSRRLLGRTISELKADLGAAKTHPERAATRIRSALARRKSG